MPTLPLSPYSFARDGFAAFDLLNAGYITRYEIEDLLEISEWHCRSIYLNGGGFGSLEGKDSPGFDYCVVTGDVIKERAAWFYDRCAGIYAELAGQAAGRAVYLSKILRSSLAINRIEGVGGRYEKHIDGNPITGLLYLTTNGPDDGGGLEIFQPGNDDPHETTIIQPLAGRLVIFDGAHNPHQVQPLKRDTARVSIPMTYIYEGTNEDRPAGLTDYLYGAEE